MQPLMQGVVQSSVHISVDFVSGNVLVSSVFFWFFILFLCMLFQVKRHVHCLFACICAYALSDCGTTGPEEYQHPISQKLVSLFLFQVPTVRHGHYGSRAPGLWFSEPRVLVTHSFRDLFSVC